MGACDRGPGLVCAGCCCCPHASPAAQLAESTGKRVHLLLPDEVEFKRASDM